MCAGWRGARRGNAVRAGGPCISPEFTTGRWVGIRGIVRANPSLAICRSQQDIELQRRPRRTVRIGVLVYGNYLNGIGFAARKLGVRWTDIATA